MSRFFQGLENSARKFPSLGKYSARFSKAWKNGGFIFQSLMDTTKVVAGADSESRPTEIVRKKRLWFDVAGSPTRRK
jgi:hypothetical protein